MTLEFKRFQFQDIQTALFWLVYLCKDLHMVAKRIPLGNKIFQVLYEMFIFF